MENLTLKRIVKDLSLEIGQVKVGGYSGNDSISSVLIICHGSDTLGFPSPSTVDKGQGTTMTSEGGWKTILGELHGTDTEIMKSRF